MEKLIKTLLVIVIFGSLQVINASGFEYENPKEIEDGWEVGSIYDSNVKPDSLFSLIKKIEHKTYDKIHCILLVKNNKLIFEQYYPGNKYKYWSPTSPSFDAGVVDYGIDSVHNIHSATKAFTSILIGIAIDKGFIESVDEPIFKFFPEYIDLRDSLKAKITIKHLLTCTSGLQWNELDAPKDPSNDLVKLLAKVLNQAISDEEYKIILPTDNLIEFILSKPCIAEPGTKWYYSGGDLVLLGEIIKKATGLRMDKFAAKYLFENLGIENYKWELIDTDIVNAWGMLEIRPRDLAKLGYLFINNGKWKNKQIVSKEWLLNSSTKHIDVPITDEAWGKLSYGYQWFLKTTEINNKIISYFFRPGVGTQCLAVFPEYNVVLVMTGGYWPSDGPVIEIIEKFILPSIVTD
jgi:CubicO group peptidase (beta-lactamase class C family)